VSLRRAAFYSVTGSTSHLQCLQTAVFNFSCASCEEKCLPPVSLAEVCIHFGGNNRLAISIHRSQTTRLHIPDVNFKSLIVFAIPSRELTRTEATSSVSTSTCTASVCCLQTRPGGRSCVQYSVHRKSLCISLSCTS
jgi:hypothetical protein